MNRYWVASRDIPCSERKYLADWLSAVAHVVGREVPPGPVLAPARRQDAPRLQHLKVGVVLHYDDPGLVPGLQDGLQHEEVVAVGVDGEQVECLLDVEPLEDLHNVVRPEDDFLQSDVRVLVTSVQQERFSYVPTFLLSGMDNSIKAATVLSRDFNK